MKEQEGKEVQVIINPISGVGSKRKIPKMIQEMYRDTGCHVNVSFTDYAGHASVLTKEALARGVKIILAVGGDGTVNEVARSMLYTDAVLGIIPKGSGNGLARDLHIPTDVKKAQELMMKGYVTTIDYGKANDRVFFCTCGVGFDAAVSEKFATERRRGSLTYLKNMIEEYLSYEPELYEILINDQAIQEKAFLVACANASQYGNNAYIAPHADIKDGCMDVTILAPFTPLDVAPIAIQLFTRQLDKNSKIKTIKAKQVTIVRQKPGIMHLDGEPVMADDRIDVRIIPQALNVYTPEKVSLVKEVHQFFEEATRFFDNKLSFLTLWDKKITSSDKKR